MEGLFLAMIWIGIVLIFIGALIALVGFAVAEDNVGAGIALLFGVGVLICLAVAMTCFGYVEYNEIIRERCILMNGAAAC